MDKAKSRYTKFKRFAHEIGGTQLPHWTSVALWSLGALILLGFTGRDLRSIVADYSDVDENVQVNIRVGHNDSFESPELFVCVPYLSTNPLENYSYFGNLLEELRNSNGTCSGRPICQCMIEHSWDDVWRHSSVSAPFFERDLREAILDKVFDQLDTFSIDLEQDSFQLWQKPVLGVIMNLIGKITEGDREFYLAANKFANDWKSYDQLYFDPRILQAPSAKATYIANLTYPSLRSMNRSTVELNKLFAIIADYYTRVLNNRNDGDIYDRILRRGYVLSHLEVFCIPFDLSEPSRAEVQSFADSCFDSLMTGSSFKWIQIHNEYKLFDFGPTEYTSLYQVKTDYAEVWQADVKYTLENRVVENRRRVLDTCYDDKTKVNCIVRCQTERIVEMCSCVPFTTRYLVPTGDPNITICDGRRLSECRSGVIERMSECERGQCARACVYNTYQWQFATSTVRLQPNESFHGTRFTLTTLRYPQPYLEFTVNDKSGREDLISQMGGVFSFYLGTSGLSIVFLIIFFLDLWRRSWRKRAAGGAKSAGHLPIVAGLQWRMWAALASSNSDSKFDEVQSEIKIVRDDQKDTREILDRLIDEVKALRNGQVVEKLARKEERRMLSMKPGMENSVTKAEAVLRHRSL